MLSVDKSLRRMMRMSEREAKLMGNRTGKTAGNKERMRKMRGECFGSFHGAGAVDSVDHTLHMWYRFWNEPTAHTPESRTEVHQYMAEKRKEGARKE